MKVTSERIENAQIELRELGHDISAHDPQEITDHIEWAGSMKHAVLAIDYYWTYIDPQDINGLADEIEV